LSAIPITVSRLVKVFAVCHFEVEPLNMLTDRTMADGPWVTVKHVTIAQAIIVIFCSALWALCDVFRLRIITRPSLLAFDVIRERSSAIDEVTLV